MSKGSDIRFSIVHACKQHGAGLQLAIDLNIAIQCTLNWCEPDDEDEVQLEQDMTVQYWNDYSYEVKSDN